MSAPAAAPPARPVACPICGRPAEPALRPFCSVRCADVDLGRWLNERYAIPVPDPDAPPADPDALPPGPAPER